MEELTIFDKILSREIPAEIVHEDEIVLAFKDVSPQAPTHILVIPKTKVDRFANLKSWQDDEIGRFFRHVARVAEKLGLAESGYRVVMNNGPDALQSVPYLHAHILGGATLGHTFGSSF